MIHSFWTSVFWPYFQFVVFILALVYLARKPIHGFLSSKRDEFRTKLSEAHEALTLAERKIQQYEAQISTLTQHIENIDKQYKQTTEIEQKRILDEANLASEAILADAKRTSLELISQTQSELKSEMYKLVLKEFEKQLTPERLTALEVHMRKDVVESIPQALAQQESQSSSL